MTRKCKHGRLLPTGREMEILDLFKAGWSFKDIGDAYGLSRERIRQIAKKTFGITGKQRIKLNCFNENSLKIYLEAKQHTELIRAHRQAVFYRWFGCHEEVVTHINGEPFSWTREGRMSLAGEYVDHRRNAIDRGVPWEMTFREWWGCWDESGMYNLRGRRKGQYVMARYGDCGAYEPNNVYICKAEDNIKDIYNNKSDEELIKMRLRRKKSHCLRGHELSIDTVWTNNKTGTRQCKECHKIRHSPEYLRDKSSHSGQLQASA